ncbi:MAG: hypothetical protein JSV90_00900 [Methanobacteriota archaeon]|nr:MAG: hypothetical protein JSV90_00900 [Euryarchaeota archaeon]
MDLDETFRTVGSKVSTGRVSASYHPYRELRHTWRHADGVLAFRISDYMRGSSQPVMESLAWYLLCRARGADCPKGMEERYLRHVRTREFWSNRRDQYLGRAKNLAFRAMGNERDLGAAFDHVNKHYFDGSVERPELAWASGSPRTRVGFFHVPLGVRAVNRALDSARVPRYVLEFVVYHELLHSLLDVEDGVSRRVRHTPEFRRREKVFERYDDARKWLTRIARRQRSEGGCPPGVTARFTACVDAVSSP